MTTTFFRRLGRAILGRGWSEPERMPKRSALIEPRAHATAQRASKPPPYTPSQPSPRNGAQIKPAGPSRPAQTPKDDAPTRKRDEGQESGFGFSSEPAIRPSHRHEPVFQSGGGGDFGGGGASSSWESSDSGSSDSGSSSSSDSGSSGPSSSSD